jgi:hypothetical protein
VAIVILSGCTSSQPTAAVSPTTSQPISDREHIRQGITFDETTCIGELPRGDSTDKCIINSTDKEKIIDSIILKLREKEEKCLKDLPRSKDTSLCTVRDSDKTFIGFRVAGTRRPTEYLDGRLEYSTHSIDWWVDYQINGWIFLPYPSHSSPGLRPSHGTFPT